MFDIDPTELAGLLVSRVIHAINPGIQNILDEADIPIAAKEISILKVFAAIGSPDQMNWRNWGS